MSRVNGHENFPSLLRREVCELLVGHQTSPSRQSQVISAVVSSTIPSGKPTGMTNNDRSSSGVRVTPTGASTDVVPSHGSQPRATYRGLPASEALSAPS